MFWARSQLFWKIVGFYALLTGLALIALVVTLKAQMSEHAELNHQKLAHTVLQRIAEEIQNSPPDQVLGSWNQSVAVHEFRIWLVDDRARSLIDLPADHDVPQLPVTMSAVRAAFRSGDSVRWLQPLNIHERQLVMSLRCQPQGSPESVLLLVGGLQKRMEELGIVRDAASRSAFYTWLIGVLVVAVVAAGLVVPLRAMTENLGTGVERSLRQDMLMRISDRHDELGTVAQSLTELEEDREDRITELLESEKQSRTTVNLLTAVLDSMIEGVIAIDHDERILFLNAAARRLLAIGNVIGVGHRLYEAVRIPAMLETIGESLRDGELQTLEFRTPLTGVHLAMVVCPIRRPRQAGAVAVVRDVSDLRRLEAMRRDFVSGVSHELKTPLTVIQACTDTLINGAMDDPIAAKRFLTQIEEQSERLLQLILGMLQLARVESGNEVFQFEEVNLNEVVREVVEGMQPVADSRQIQLLIPETGEMNVTSDWQAVRTIISNLVDNAIKHTPDDGTITLQIEPDGTNALVIVRDTGSGIPSEHLPRIFERFYRVDRDRSRDRGGTGLGLAIVKHLCQHLRAQVSVSSEPGRGTEFRVSFPA
ncbi:MAG: ATP-binding protein [Planctomycetaceae bacterium]